MTEVDALRKASSGDRDVKKAIAAGLLLASALAHGGMGDATSSQWTDWEPTQLLKKDSGKEWSDRAWESKRVVDDQVRVVASAIVIASPFGVICAVGYRSYDYVQGGDDAPLQVMESQASIEHVKGFDGVQQALAGCRQAIEEKTGLE